MTPLQTAAQAVIDRWDSPSWKDQPHTVVYIAELRKALAVEQAQQVATNYDQQALDLCPECGWKAIMPGDPCFVCNMQTEAQQVAVPAPLTDKQSFDLWESSYSAVSLSTFRSIMREIETSHGIGAKK